MSFEKAYISLESFQTTKLENPGYVMIQKHLKHESVFSASQKWKLQGKSTFSINGFTSTGLQICNITL